MESMKKIRSLVLIVAILSVITVATVVFSPAYIAEADGRYSVPFECEEDGSLSAFDCYTEIPTEREYFVRDGYLFAEGKAESKFILKSFRNLSSFSMSADFYPLDEICPMNEGFYFYASRARNRADLIDGYNIQIEKSVNSSYFYLKLHYFKQDWKGALTEARVKIKSFPISLTVVADEGYIEAYVEGYSQAVLSYDIGDDKWSPGAVGLRTMRECGSKIGNYSLTADCIETDTSELEALLAETRTIDMSTLTDDSQKVLSDAIREAEEALASGVQVEVDNAAASLRDAIEGRVEHYSFETLEDTIAQASAIVSGGGARYTVNTFESLKLVLSRAEELTIDSGEKIISETTSLLKNRLLNLTLYKD